jgi:hypothetical protein
MYIYIIYNDFICYILIYMKIIQKIYNNVKINSYIINVICLNVKEELVLNVIDWSVL